MDEKQFLIEKVLSAKADLKQRDISDALAIIRHDTVNMPVVYIGSGTCGKVAGAGETYNKVVKYLEEKNIIAEIVQVGCIGLCSYEPIVDIQLPGKARISFRNITQEKVEPLLDDIFNSEVPYEHVLGQYNIGRHNKWDNVPYLNELPFLKFQHRIVLANCGVSNPDSISDYMTKDL